jgi:hypothetical protein
MERMGGNLRVRERVERDKELGVVLWLGDDSDSGFANVIGCHADNLMRGNKSGKNFRVLKEIILHR